MLLGFVESMNASQELNVERQSRQRKDRGAFGHLALWFFLGRGASQLGKIQPWRRWGYRNVGLTGWSQIFLQLSFLEFVSTCLEERDPHVSKTSNHRRIKRRQENSTGAGQVAGRTEEGRLESAGGVGWTG